jgi:hypothetical protein
MADLETCACCGARVAPVRPSVAARLAFYAAVVPLALMLLAYPFLGFLWTFVIPVVMAAGMGIGPLIDAAFAPAICPACDRRFTAVPAEERLPAAQPATILRA